ncbi:MAG: hypothetical protein U0401_34005 [Anaerolineae bacterium]
MRLPRWVCVCPGGFASASAGDRIPHAKDAQSGGAERVSPLPIIKGITSMPSSISITISLLILVLILGLSAGCSGLNADPAQPPEASFSTKGRVASLSFSPDGQLLAAAEVNGGPGQNNQWTSSDPSLPPSPCVISRTAKLSTP